MQTNRRKIGDIVYKPSHIYPLTVMRCLINGVTINPNSFTINWKKMDEIIWQGDYSVLYHVVEELHPDSPHHLWTAIYPQTALFETMEEALVFIMKTAKEVLDITDADDTTSNDSVTK